MCNNNEQNCNCFDKVINTILTLQNTKICFDDCNGCDKPYLGNNTSCFIYNTRPVTFYTCCNGNLWEMPYELNGISKTSTVFRLEKVNECCCTCRILAPNPDVTSDLPYIATDSFFTINLKCVGTIKCLQDTYVACI